MFPSRKTWLVLVLALCWTPSSAVLIAEDLPLRIGVATVDITPGENYPMSGYYHERLATGVKDPLQAKAIVFEQGNVSAAMVVCDLISIAADLTAAVRQSAEAQTGIPADQIMVSGTHTHTGPDYAKEMFAHATGRPLPTGATPREPYVPRLIEAIVSAIVQAKEGARPATLFSGTARQDVPVSFHRRFLMKDGTVRTWMNLQNPDVIHAAGPIDPEIGIVQVLDAERKTSTAVLSSFALHLDTVGGLEWSADYPFHIDRTIKEHLGREVVSIFGTGCCGNINHVNPSTPDRNKADFIGTHLGETICDDVSKLGPVESPFLQIRRSVVRLPLQDVSPEQLTSSKQILREIQQGKTGVDFFQHVDAYKKVVLSGLRGLGGMGDVDERYSLIGWGLSSSLSGSGDTLPVEVQVISLGRDVAIVALPGEVFVELGLAIKNASPFKTTLVVELSNIGETIYIPTRYAYIGGGYEVVNSVLKPGSGELLAETAIRLLAESAAAVTSAP